MNGDHSAPIRTLHPPRLNYVFTRAARTKNIDNVPLVGASERLVRRGSRSVLRTATSDKYLPVKTQEARYPRGSAWPLQMRADMVAAYLDFDGTRDLCEAIKNGNAPLPTAARVIRKKLEAVWHKNAIDKFVYGPN